MELQIPSHLPKHALVSSRIQQVQKDTAIFITKGSFSNHPLAATVTVTSGFPISLSRCAKYWITQKS